jgi:hypothetical protein
MGNPAGCWSWSELKEKAGEGTRPAPWLGTGSLGRKDCVRATEEEESRASRKRAAERGDRAQVFIRCLSGWWRKSIGEGGWEDETEGGAARDVIFLRGGAPEMSRKSGERIEKSWIFFREEEDRIGWIFFFFSFENPRYFWIKIFSYN